MTADIVNGLEAVDVDEEHGRTFAGGFALTQRVADAMLEDHAIGKIGHGVVIAADRGNVDVAGSNRQGRAGRAGHTTAFIHR